MKKSKIIEIIAGSLILLFVYAACSKLFDHQKFSEDMHNQPFPRWLASFFAWGVPFAELLITGALLFEGTRGTGFLASLILLTLFTFYIGAILLHFFPRVPCSCGGVIRKLSWGQHLFFNLFFMTLSGIGLYLQSRSNERSSSNDKSWPNDRSRSNERSRSNDRSGPNADPGRNSNPVIN